MKKVKKKKKNKKKEEEEDKSEPGRRKTRAMAVDSPSDHELDELVAAQKAENPTEWWMQICPEEELDNIEHSSKLMLLFSIVEKSEQIGNKLLVFSQSLYSLDVIEHFLNVIDEQTQQLNAADVIILGIVEFRTRLFSSRRFHASRAKKCVLQDF